MVATVILRKDKTTPLTWDEMDANFVALRDTPGPQGLPGIQGIPGTAGPAADASVSAMLSIDSIVLSANVDGVVPPSSYDQASTHMLIMLGILDDTPNWTFTKTDSPGITSTIVGSTVTLTKINDTTDTGTVTITAKRPGGYPDLVRKFAVAKAKAGDAGPAGTAGPAADASVSAILTSEAYIFPASQTGVIAAADYAPATSTMMVILGIADDSANWTYTKTDSSGVTSTLTGNVVQITNMMDSTNTGSVMIQAKRTGYPTLRRTFDVSKAKAGPIGPDGTTGPSGPTGPTGSSGVAGIRGSRQFYVAVTKSTWNDALASSTASVSAGPVLNDTVIQYNSSTGFVQTRFWTGSAWAIVNVVINGNLLVDGTVSADKIVTGTITANSGVLAEAAVGTLTIAGNAVTQAIALNQVGVSDGQTGMGTQINVVPSAVNIGGDFSTTETGWATAATRSGVEISGTQPVLVWGACNWIGLHAKYTGNPASPADDDKATHVEVYAGYTWINNMRATWYRTQVVFTHADGTQYFAKAGDGIITPGAPNATPLCAMFPSMKAGTYTVKFQGKIDSLPAWTAAGTPIEPAGLRQSKLIVLETKR